MILSCASKMKDVMIFCTEVFASRWTLRHAARIEAGTCLVINMSFVELLVDSIAVNITAAVPEERLRAT
jgi:hypothetical protein